MKSEKNRVSIITKIIITAHDYLINIFPISEKPEGLKALSKRLKEFTLKRDATKQSIFISCDFSVNLQMDIMVSLNSQQKNCIKTPRKN